MTIRRQHCQQEAPLKCCDKTNGMLCTYGVKYYDNSFPSMMDYRMSGQVSKRMLEDMQQQVFQYCDAKMYPTQAYSLKRWTRL